MGSVLTSATALICEGPLKTGQGLKLQCFLFDSGLVLTRTLSNNRLSLYKNPFDVSQIRIVDMGTKVGRNNSFLPGSSGNSLGTKHVFKVETPTDNITLVTFNEHNKKQWMLGLHRVTEEWRSSNQNQQQLIKETSDADSAQRCVPKIKASLNVRGPNRRNLMPRSKLQVISAPQLAASHLHKQSQHTPSPHNHPMRFLRSKGSICLNQTLSPETHRICTRSCTSLKAPALVLSWLDTQTQSISFHSLPLLATTTTQIPTNIPLNWFKHFVPCSPLLSQVEWNTFLSSVPCHTDCNTALLFYIHSFSSAFVILSFGGLKTCLSFAAVQCRRPSTKETSRARANVLES